MYFNDNSNKQQSLDPYYCHQDRVLNFESLSYPWSCNLVKEFLEVLPLSLSSLDSLPFSFDVIFNDIGNKQQTLELFYCQYYERKRLSVNPF